MTPKEPMRLMIAGGGTGGHLFPAIAVCEEVERQGGEVLFVGTARGLESRILPKMGKNLATLEVGQLKGRGVMRRLRTLMGLPKAWLAARKLVRAFRPHAVLGMGGYASAPAVAAAWSMGVATALHEQNAKPGMTNRYLGQLADRIFLSFPQAAGAFSASKGVLVGNPVRGNFWGVQSASRSLAGAGQRSAGIRGGAPAESAAPGNPASRVAEDQQNGVANRLSILIFGGSQGAEIFSKMAPPALIRLRAHGVGVEVRHQAPKGDVEALEATYGQAGIEAQVVPFIDDMASAYRGADLVICRAGATTVAELAAVGRGALLVPYPYAADDHQAANAMALEEIGGGWMRRQEHLDADWLYDFLKQRVEDPEGLQKTGEAARQLARPDAAERMVESLWALSQGAGERRDV
ncbi:MAG: undecaprenyldiphospho-muramoylpentapeptide beta-N-acetylglucosaminyltransferase [Magnetococcales bacterium]|nr:undecaprenyldiphospho-muramoylpentapeptide beta-N-acetylglucosaminyltransferase [Magnetococcales bacterium]